MGTVFGRNLASNKHLRCLRVLISCAAVGLLSRFAWTAFQEIPTSDLVQARQGLLAALLIASVYRAAIAFGWGLILRSIGQSMPVGQGARIWIVSEAMRWLPGSIWNLTSRVSQARKLGVPGEAAALSLPLEYGLTIMAWVCVAVVCSLFTGTFGVALDAFPAWALWAVGLLLLSSVGAAVMIGKAKVVAITRSVLNRATLARIPSDGRSIRNLLLVFGMYCGLCVLHGAGLALLLGCFTDDQPSIWVVVAANAVAWLVGFIVPLAPSGIGVREGALCLALGHAVPVEIAALSALLWRLAQVISELLIVIPVAAVHVSEGRLRPGNPVRRSS